MGQAGIGAIFDGTQKNIEATEASGVDLIARATLPTNLGKFRLIWQSEYLAKLDNQAAPGSPYISAVNTVFNPPRWREQAGASWSLGRLSISTNTNFTGSYKDTLTPGDPHISSWFTVDCGVAYSIEDRLGTTLLDHTTFEVYLRNATDRVPPRVASLADETFAYDLSHASALRRSVVLTVTKQW